MNKSESIKELAAALAKAQGQVKGAVKDSSNPFFKSKYADLASVVEAIRVAFSTHGLSYVQTVEPSEKDEVRVETFILHASGEWIGCGVLSLPVVKADAQGYGSALTYARRYSLSAACGVAPEDDDGNAASFGGKNIPKEGVHKPTDGAFQNLTTDERTVVMDCAKAVRDWLSKDKVREAFDEIEFQKFSPDSKVALWAQLDSKQRSALTKEGEKRANPA